MQFLSVVTLADELDVPAPKIPPTLLEKDLVKRLSTWLGIVSNL